MIKIKNSNKIIHVEVFPKANLTDTESFLEEIAAAMLPLNNWEKMILDLTHLAWVDSMDMGFIIRIFNKVKAEQKEFEIIGCNDIVYQSLQMFSLTILFPITKTIK